MYEIEIKDLSNQLEPVLAVVDSGGEVVLTKSQRPIARITKIVESDLSEAATRSVEMARILEQLAALDPFSDITDPVLWQRESRQDRALAGRE
ncbi:MAG: type II toxin-antitoxin system prevent-host-death family antitoxin [Blastocatellia bacterium]